MAQKSTFWYIEDNITACTKLSSSGKMYFERNKVLRKRKEKRLQTLDFRGKLVLEYEQSGRSWMFQTGVFLKDRLHGKVAFWYKICQYMLMLRNV